MKGLHSESQFPYSNARQNVFWKDFDKRFYVVLSESPIITNWSRLLVAADFFREAVFTPSLSFRKYQMAGKETKSN